MSVFVDTSVWYAAVDSRDADNARAKRILGAGESLVTSDHVASETWALIHRRVGFRAAERFWRALRSGIADLEFVTPADLELAWQMGQSFEDQELSMVDRTSFAVMRRLGIERVASLDHHFAVIRFGPSKRRAFTIVD